MPAHVSLPSVGTPRQCSAYSARRRSRRRRQFLGDDRFVEVWIGKAVNRRRVLYRGLGDLLIAALVKCLVGTCGVLRPFRKLLRWYDVDVEVHVGESVAAEMRRQALKCS